MDKRDYFLAGLKAGCYRYKRWVLEAFSMTRANAPWPGDAKGIPYALHRDDQGRYFFYQGPESQVEYLEGTTPGQPAFTFHDAIALNPGDLFNLSTRIVSNYGNLLVNQLCLVYPFGDKIPYMEGKITIPRIEKIIEARLVDDPVDGLTGEEATGIKAPLYVTEYKKYNEAAFALSGYAQLCVPSATAKTMTTDPKIAVRRQELLTQYKDQLNDPVIQAKIDAELIAMDKAWMKGDLGEGFYIKAKSYDVVRKKTFLLQGASEGFGVAGELVPTPLNDGWDVDNLPAMSNSLRSGSYGRGAETMLGGEATKFNYRIFQNTVIAEEDCGSPFGLPITIPAEQAAYYASYSIITPQGLVELTEENLPQYVDKEVMLRSPTYCRTEGVNFCATCMGKRIGQTPNAISTYAADVGSLFMLISMSKMHGKSLRTAVFDLKGSIT